MKNIKMTLGLLLFSGFFFSANAKPYFTMSTGGGESWGALFEGGFEMIEDHHLGLGFYTRLGSKTYTYSNDAICKELELIKCDTQLQEYLWGPSIFYHYQYELGFIKLGFNMGGEFLFSFNEGTKEEEKVFRIFKIGPEIGFKIGEEVYLNFRYDYLQNFDDRTPYRIYGGFSWEL